MEIDIERFSRLLLNLYRAAENTPLKEFRNAALGEIQQHLPFDGVMWTTTRLSGSRSSHHVWAYAGVSRDLLRLLENDPHGRIGFEVTKETLGKPRIWNAEDMTPGTQMAALTAYAGMRQIVIVSDLNEALDVFTVLIVGRRDLRQPFDAGDQTLLRLLMPHLQAAMGRNVESRTMATLVNRIAGDVGLAIVTNDSIVLEEANFAQIMQNAWPRYSGSLLPVPIQQAMHAGRKIVSFDGATIHLMYREDHVLLIATPPSALHTLTRKEFTIASDFAQGKSYKEVARHHGLPPETVRSRLRSVYEKLSVTDKAELSRRFAQTEMLLNLQNPF